MRRRPSLHHTASCRRCHGGLAAALGSRCPLAAPFAASARAAAGADGGAAFAAARGWCSASGHSRAWLLALLAAGSSAAKASSAPGKVAQEATLPTRPITFAAGWLGSVGAVPVASAAAAVATAALATAGAPVGAAPSAAAVVVASSIAAAATAAVAAPTAAAAAAAEKEDEPVEVDHAPRATGAAAVAAAASESTHPAAIATVAASPHMGAAAVALGRMVSGQTLLRCKKAKQRTRVAAGSACASVPSWLGGPSRWRRGGAASRRGHTVRRRAEARRAAAASRGGQAAAAARCGRTATLPPRGIGLALPRSGAPPSARPPRRPVRAPPRTKGKREKGAI